MILERFSNPAIGDQLERIANNGMAKLPIFLAKTLLMLLERGGPFERVALELACFERYLGGRDMDGRGILVSEPLLTDADQALLASRDPLAVLRLSAFATLGLCDNAGLVSAFAAARSVLAEEGSRAALRRAAMA